MQQDYKEQNLNNIQINQQTTKNHKQLTLQQIQQCINMNQINFNNQNTLNQQINQDQNKSQDKDDQESDKNINQIIKLKPLKTCGLRQGCQDINNYKRLNKIHQGTFGVVYRAIQLPTNKTVAIKKLKIVQGQDFPITSLRQIAILRGINHPNIMKITRVAGTQQKDRVFIIMQYIDHQLKQLLKKVTFNQSQTKKLMKDLLQGINHLHEKKIVHRDLKTSNLLYSNQGILKICDFGLARKASQAIMTQEVITMWYRPPEFFLGPVVYSTEIDVWSIGCIMAEIILKQALFRGKSQLQQLDLIFKTIGSPTQESWPQFKTLKNAIYVKNRKFEGNKLRDLISKELLSDQGINLLTQMLVINPKKRITAKKALLHPWFKNGICLAENMPKHDPLNQVDRVKKKIKVQ